ncbi:MAG: hypothetical protein DMF79_08615, partial [Acidobacteria bacterium]
PARAAELVRSLLPRRDTADMRKLLGDAEEAAGHLLEAAEQFQKAAHMDPTEEHLFDWGNNLLRLRAFEPASRVFVEAVKRYPRSARLAVGLGISEYSRGQYDDAVRSFCDAADLDPGDPRPYVFLGEMYGVSPALADEVTRRLALLVRTHPENALGHFHYAMSLWKGRADPAAPGCSRGRRRWTRSWLRLASGWVPCTSIRAATRKPRRSSARPSASSPTWRRLATGWPRSISAPARRPWRSRSSRPSGSSANRARSPPRRSERGGDRARDRGAVDVRPATWDCLRQRSQWR